MSWTDEEIDKVFGEASNMQTFEYRPEYWKDIEKQLPVNKTRKPIFWWITGSAFVIGFVSLFFVDVYPNETKIAFADNTNNAVSNATAKSENSAISSNENKIKENTSTINGNRSNQKVIVETKQLNKNSKTQQNATNTNRINKTTPHTTRVENVEVSNAMNENLSSVTTEENNLTAEENNIESNVRSETAKAPVVSQEENTFIGSLPIIHLQFDQINAELINGDLSFKKKSALSLYVEFNGALSQGWVKTEQNTQAVNGSMGIATGVVLPFNKFILSAGLGFQGTKLDNLNIKERTKVYGFGSAIIENTYQINSIGALTLPVSIGYNMGRHSLSFGVSTTMNLYTGLKRTQSIDGNQTIYSKGIGNTSLFNRFGIQPSLGYGFYINENIQIGVRANVQLMQPIQSDRFIGTPVKMPFEGQFYLKRTINF